MVLRAAALLALVALSGCVGSVAPTVDIAAPEPHGGWPTLEQVFPDDEPFTLRGRVVDPLGRPVEGALVWVEAEDLRQPVDDLATYAQGRAESLRVTGGDGAFRISADDGLYRVAVQADGYRPLRSVPSGTSAPFDLVLVPDEGMRILAHRGASFYAPENTLPAIRKAAWLGADVVEVDVRLTVDGRVVLMHDEDVSRTTNGTGEVRSLTLAEVRGLDAGSWFDDSFAGTPVPTLVEAVTVARAEGVRVILDLKAPAQDAARLRLAVAQEVHGLGAEEDVWVAAFRNATVDFCHRQGLQCAKISRGAQDMDALLMDAARRGADVVLLEATTVTPRVVTTAHALGLQVHAWTVNDETAWRGLRDLGVDGVLTDRPGYLLDVLTDREPQEAP